MWLARDDILGVWKASWGWGCSQVESGGAAVEGVGEKLEGPYAGAGKGPDVGAPKRLVVEAPNGGETEDVVDWANGG